MTVDKTISIFFGQKLKELRKKERYTQSELALKLGVGKSTVANYEKGYRMPRQQFLYQLADIFNVTIDVFFPSRNDLVIIENELDENLLKNVHQLSQARQEKVYSYAESQLEEQRNDFTVHEEQPTYIIRPVVALLSAGDGEWQESDNLDIEISIPEGINESSADAVGLVVGNSMSPRFKDGDYVFIDTKRVIEYGQIGVFKINNKNYIKRLQLDNSGKIYLESLNTEYDDIFVESTDENHVLGVVIGSYRK